VSDLCGDDRPLACGDGDDSGVKVGVILGSTMPLYIIACALIIAILILLEKFACKTKDTQVDETKKEKEMEEEVHNAGL